jgi:hypothetical protein
MRGGVVADDVAERIDGGLHAGGAHPARDQIGGAAVLGSQVATGKNVRIFADRAELIALLQDPGAVRHGMQSG